MKTRFSLSPLIGAAITLCAVSSALAARGPLVDVYSLHHGLKLGLGQKVVLAFDVQGEKLINPHRVKDAKKKPSITIESFTDKKGLPILVVRSSYPRNIGYRAAAREQGTKEFYATDMNPVMPNVPSMETWDTLYVEFVLYDFHFTSESPVKS